MKFKVGDLVRLDWGKSYVDEPGMASIIDDTRPPLGFIQKVCPQTALVKWVNGRGGYYKFAELEKIASREENVNEKI